MEVPFYPYSIFVDNRDNIVVGKGKDQHIKYSLINFDTEEIKDLEHLYGYEKDYLIYSEEKDAFMAITQSHTGDNPWYKFNGTEYVDVYSSNSNLNSINYICNNGHILIQVGYESLIIGSFHSGLNDYVFETHTIYYDQQYYSEKINVTYDNNKIYYLASYTDSNIGTLGIVDLETGSLQTFKINILSYNVESIHYYNDKIYVCYLDGKILETFQVE